MWEYARTGPDSAQKSLDLPYIGGGAEHQVFYAPGENSVYKATLPFVYGDLNYIENGKMGQRQFTPKEYLARMPLWKELFGEETMPEVLGYTSDGRIITRQAYAGGEQPTQQEVDAALLAWGFEPVRKEMYLWRKMCEKGRMIYLADARDDNFVKAKDGELVPIDVRLWATKPGQDPSWMEH